MQAYYLATIEFIELEMGKTLPREDSGSLNEQFSLVHIIDQLFVLGDDGRPPLIAFRVHEQVL